MKAWEIALNEVAIHPDPIAWLTVGGTRLNPSQLYMAFHECHKRGYIKQCGKIVTDVVEPLYCLTDAGREYWEKHVKGKRKRPVTSTPVPKYTRAQITAAIAPRSVFDLSIVPCTFDLKFGLRREFNLWIKKNGVYD